MKDRAHSSESDPMVRAYSDANDPSVPPSALLKKPNKDKSTFILIDIHRNDKHRHQSIIKLQKALASSNRNSNIILCHLPRCPVSLKDHSGTAIPMVPMLAKSIFSIGARHEHFSRALGFLFQFLTLHGVGFPPYITDEHNTDQ